MFTLLKNVGSVEPSSGSVCLGQTALVSADEGLLRPQSFYSFPQRKDYAPVIEAAAAAETKTHIKGIFFSHKFTFLK